MQTNSISLLVHAITLVRSLFSLEPKASRATADFSPSQVVMVSRGQALWYSISGFQMSKLYTISLIASRTLSHSSPPSSRRTH